MGPNCRSLTLFFSPLYRINVIFYHSKGGILADELKGKGGGSCAGVGMKMGTGGCSTAAHF